MTEATNNILPSSVSPIPASYDPEMEEVLRKMLEADEDVTARAVIRRHSSLNAASSITRNPARSEMLAKCQAQQEEFRGWRKRLVKRSKDSAAMDMAEKDLRIAELERQVELLTASHVAMLRAVGEIGGFSKWSKFFENYKNVRDELIKMEAMPDTKVIPLDEKSK